MELEYGYDIHENLSFEVMDDKSIVIYRKYPKLRKLAIWFKPLVHLYLRKICVLEIKDFEMFVKFYNEK